MAQEIQKQTPGLKEQVQLQMAEKQEQFLSVLGSQDEINRWYSLLATAVYRNPDLAACDPGSLVSSVLEAAQWGLEFGAKQHGYLVPYKGACTFLPGYRGLIHLAKKSGETKDIRAEAVYAKDEFAYELGLDKALSHRPAVGVRGEMVAVYAVVVFADDRKDFEVMSREQVEHIRGKSASQKGPWATDFDEMAKKTVIKRICKRLDLVPQLDAAIERDNEFFDAPKMRMPEEVTA